MPEAELGAPGSMVSAVCCPGGQMALEAQTQRAKGTRLSSSFPVNLLGPDGLPGAPGLG